MSENSALSNRRLIQKYWNAIPIDENAEIPSGWQAVSTVSWQKLCQKYSMEFDTLVVDCEGALYYILLDQPRFVAKFYNSHYGK